MLLHTIFFIAFATAAYFLLRSLKEQMQAAHNWRKLYLDLCKRMSDPGYKVISKQFGEEK